MMERLVSIGLLISMIATTSCASLVNGTTQRVEIRTNPPGATALILPEGEIVRTPAVVVLERKRAHTVLFERSGHCPDRAYVDRELSGWLYASAWPAFLAGVIPGLVAWYFVERDKGNGSAYELTPALVDVDLRALDADCRLPPPDPSAPSRNAKRVP